MKKILILISVVTFFSCVTLPEEKTAAHWLGFLNHPYDVTAFFSVTNNRKLLVDTLQSSPLWQDIYNDILNNTKFLYAGINAGDIDPFVFDVVLLGSYPGGIISAVLGADSSWIKIENADQSWWRHKMTGLEVGIPKPYCILLSTAGGMGNMLVNITNEARFSAEEEVIAGFNEGDIFLYFKEPGKNILPLLSRSKRDTISYPVSDSWIGFYRFDQRYIVDGFLTLGSDKAARASVVALRMLFFGWMKEDAELMAQKNSLIIKSMDSRIHVGNIYISPDFTKKIISGFIE